MDTSMLVKDITPKQIKVGMLWYRRFLASEMELMHYGVKGMKWGVRRSKEELRYNRGSIESTVNRYLSYNITTRDGTHVNNISAHAAEQAESRKVSTKDILDATERSLYISAVKTDGKGRRSKQYIGKDATVAINPDTGIIVTAWPTSSDRAKKYMNRR